MISVVTVVTFFKLMKMLLPSPEERRIDKTDDFHCVVCQLIIYLELLYHVRTVTPSLQGGGISKLQDIIRSARFLTILILRGNWNRSTIIKQFCGDTSITRTGKCLNLFFYML